MSPEAPWYRLLDHAGDVALLVRAPTLAALYSAATRALFDVILDVGTVEARDRVEVRIEDAADAEDLLVRYLSELLYLHEAQGWLFREAQVLEAEPLRLVAEVGGERFDPGRHAIARQVKAVTYHDLRVSEDAQGFTARLVLDL